MDRDFSHNHDYLVDRFTRRFDVAPGTATTNVLLGDKVAAIKAQFVIKISIECENTWTGIDCNTGNLYND